MARTVDITDQGGSFIPASQRPDGSWRKPRRVKEGYVPQEEVPLYESKGKQWASSQSRQYPVGLDSAIIKAREEAKLSATRSPIPGLIIENEGKKKKKKKKNKDSEVSEQCTGRESQSNAESSRPETAYEWQTVPSKSAKATKTEPNTQSTSLVVDPAKKLKNLKKKLREIDAIEKKIADGEIKKPDKDQVEKINRKSDVLSEILGLELSLEEQ